MYRNRELGIRDLGSWAVGLGIVASLAVGCAEGPFRQLAAWNPYYSKQWEADEQRGPTFHKRIAELKLLQSQAPRLTHEEQEQYIQKLVGLIQNDSNPVIRAEAVRALAKFPSPSIIPGFRTATADDDQEVRIAACQAWGQHPDPEALQALADIVRHDAKLDVRMVATAELAKFSDPAAVAALGVALDDHDPALQYRAIQSLKTCTGEDFGNSVAAWRDFVAGRTPTAEEDPSLVERLRQLF